MPEPSNKRDAPASVKKLIDLANTVPPAIELPPFTGRNGKHIVRLVKSDESFAKFRRHIGGTRPDRFLLEIFSKLNVGVEHRATTVRSKSRSSDRVGPPKTYNRLIGEYIRLYAAREFLRWVTTIPPVPMTTRWLMPPISVNRAETNERGELHFSFLFQDFEGVVAQRIRRCQCCGQIYWAKRSDQPACSQRCVWRIRQRRWRANYLEKYKQQRKKRAEAICGSPAKSRARAISLREKASVHDEGDC
jgi:hypothetical protein